MTTFALVIGLTMINLLGPGRGMNIDPHQLSGAGLDQYVKTAQQISTQGFLLHLVPHTIVSAFTEGNVLQVVFVSVLFAFGLLAIGDRGKPVVDLLGATQQIVFKIVGYVMWLAPIGAMGAIGFTVAKFGAGSLVSLGALVGEFYLTCLLFVVLILAPIAWWGAGISLLRLANYIRAELLIVLGTSSSETVLPQMMEKMERLGASRSVVGLVIPTGYSFNLDGSTLYLSLAAIFVSQAAGHPLSLGEQVLLVVTLMLTSKGVAGVPRASLVILMATLGGFNLPVWPVYIIGSSTTTRVTPLPKYTATPNKCSQRVKRSLIGGR